MNVVDPSRFDDSPRTLVLSFVAALLILSSVLFTLSHNSKTLSPVATAPIEPIEAQIFETPRPESHLTEVKKAVVARAARPEPVLSKAPNVGRQDDSKSEALEEKNETVPQRPEITSHGPIVLSSPAPKLPSYLRNQNLKTTVLIEFVINSDGSFVPHLIGASGNDELDALALKSVRNWRFNPAIDANKPVPSKVRLRINFEVE